MKVEHIKKPTGAEYIYATEIPEDILFYARREVARAMPLMSGNNPSARDDAGVSMYFCLPSTKTLYINNYSLTHIIWYKQS